MKSYSKSVLYLVLLSAGNTQLKDRETTLAKRNVIQCLENLKNYQRVNLKTLL